MIDPTGPAAVFAVHRSLLFTIAYEITGSAADAEDVVQDSWLRWAEVDPGVVRSPRAYLARIVTRQALNRLRTAARRREDYIGPWLPEPLLTAPDVADDVVLAESVSMAMMVVLETLTPDERAVFVLREVFGFSHDEIAAAVDKKVAAVRQIAHRARAHVHARRPVRERSPLDTAPSGEAVLQRFFAATATGDLQGLMDLLAPDVVLITDGGGVRQAALRPILGAAKTARFLVGVMGGVADARIEWVLVNGAPGTVVHLDGVTDTVGSVDVVDGRISAIHLVRNPEKLHSLVVRPLSR